MVSKKHSILSVQSIRYIKDFWYLTSKSYVSNLSWQWTAFTLVPTDLRTTADKGWTSVFLTNSLIDNPAVKPVGILVQRARAGELPQRLLGRPLTLIPGKWGQMKSPGLPQWSEKVQTQSHNTRVTGKTQAKVELLSIFVYLLAVSILHMTQWAKLLTS